MNHTRDVIQANGGNISYGWAYLDDPYLLRLFAWWYCEKKFYLRNVCKDESDKRVIRKSEASVSIVLKNIVTYEN